MSFQIEPTAGDRSGRPRTAGTPPAGLRAADRPPAVLQLRALRTAGKLPYGTARRAASVLKYEPGTLPSCYAQPSSSSRHPIHPETDFVRSGSLYAILAVSKDAALLSKIDTMRVSDTRRHDATLTFDQTQIK